MITRRICHLKKNDVMELMESSELKKGLTEQQTRQEAVNQGSSCLLSDFVNFLHDQS
jgi:hypothetical protein